MTSYLPLMPNMPNMAQPQTISTPSGDNVSISVVVEPPKKTHRLSFTKDQPTPPMTPPNEEANNEQDAIPEDNNNNQDAILEDNNNNNNQDAILEDNNHNQDVFPPSKTMLVEGPKEEVTPALTDGYQDAIATGPTVDLPQLAPVVAPSTSLSPATRMKHRLQKEKGLMVCPGVYDGLSARIAMAVGFETLYMTGAGSTASMLGMADLGIASRNDMVQNADMIANLDPQKHELIADMDTGYGGPITITQTVNQYTRANVAAFHIEDQVLTKRCGHLSGKKVVSMEVYLSRIRAARAAIDRAQADIQLIARTDANQQLGYDECIARLRAARELGADVGLLEGFKSKEQAAQAVKDLDGWPLLLNIVENGHSPLITVDEARDMGFRIMIFSFAGLTPAYMGMKTAFERLLTEGVTGNQGCGIGPKALFDVCGLREAVEVDENAGGEDYKGL